MKKRLAVKWLHLPDGKVLSNQVVEFEEETPVAHYALTKELPFTEWFGGHWDWESNKPFNL